MEKHDEQKIESTRCTVLEANFRFSLLLLRDRFESVIVQVVKDTSWLDGRTIIP